MSVSQIEGGGAYLEVDPVDGIADVLEHALVGHEEVAVFEASFTAEEEEQRHTQPSDGPHLYPRLFKNMTFGFCLLLYGIAFPCWRGPQPNRKAFSP